MTMVLIIGAVIALVLGERKAAIWNAQRKARLEAFNKAWDAAQVEEARKK